MLNRLDEVAKAIGAHGRKSDIGIPFFADRRYAPAPFSEANFRNIAPAENSKKIAFLDAGNMEIFASPGLSVQFIRAYLCIFKNNARIAPIKIPKKIEFFSVSSANKEGDEMRFSTKLIPADDRAKILVSEIDGINLSASDETISQAGGFSASLSVMGGVARRFAEWLYAAKAVESELSAGDIFLRDGTLQTAVKGEADFAKTAYDAAEKKGAIFCACSKTSELLTTTGIPLASAIRMLAEKNSIASPWLYHPIAENNNPDHRGEIFACCLHKKSRRAFRFEIEKNCAKNISHEDICTIFSAISKNSEDGPFLGYPYGLIDADAKSRISFAEGANMRAMLMSVLRKNGAEGVAEALTDAKDAHDVLNKIV